MRHLCSIIVWVFCLCLPATTAFSAKKVALVIGNSNYQHVTQLPNPSNDADDISTALKDIGFEVTKFKDLAHQQFRLALRDFSDKALKSEIALIFYAGHGIEVDKHNYLVPTDAKLKKDIDVELEAISLDTLRRVISSAKGLRLILLDACRDDPFKNTMVRTVSTRSIGRGLAKVEPIEGTLISYAAKEGTVAADGTGRNSPYTKALIKHLKEPGLEVGFMFRKIRSSVVASTDGVQVPQEYGSLPNKQIYLVPPIGGASDAAKTQNQSTESGSGQSAEIAFWNSVEDSGDVGQLQLYLDRFPQGLFAGIAKSKIKNLKNVGAQNNENANGQGEDQVASLPKKTRTLAVRSKPLHLGDEDINSRKWSRLHGRCYRVSIPAVSPGGLVRLRYQGYGVEAAYAGLSVQRIRLSSQKVKWGKKRPNYWSGTQSIEFAINNYYAGGNLRICSSDVPNPGFAGDKDDLMLRNIEIEITD